MKKRTNNKKNRTKIKQETKIRAQLQQEIKSICPVPSCNSADVGHFQIHHIDENPANHDFANLLLVCPTCHSKITKGDISRQTVEVIKKNLPKLNDLIRLIAITIDSKKCNWIAYEDVRNAFKFNNNNNKSPFPILSFSFINHTPRTILLTTIRLKTKHIYSGLSGIQEPRILKPTTKYKIAIPPTDKETNLIIEDQIEVPAEQAFKFQVQLFENWNKQDFPIDGRKILYFKFEFDNNVIIQAPEIFLNCRSEDEKINIAVIS